MLRVSQITPKVSDANVELQEAIGLLLSQYSLQDDATLLSLA